jgi:transcriptional regulator with XRE-family HTH domain
MLDIEIPTADDIRKLRHAAQLTQAEFAERTDSSVRQIYGVEQGERQMSRQHWLVSRLLLDDGYLLKWLRQQMRRRPALAKALRIQVSTEE